MLQMKLSKEKVNPKKWLQFEGRKIIKKHKEMTLLDDENKKTRIIFIYDGNDSFSQRQNIEENNSNARVEWDLLLKKTVF